MNSTDKGTEGSRLTDDDFKRMYGIGAGCAKDATEKERERCIGVIKNTYYFAPDIKGFVDDIIKEINE
jgi:hypothetical protein